MYIAGRRETSCTSQGEEKPPETTEGGEDGHAGPEGEFCFHASYL